MMRHIGIQVWRIVGGLQASVGGWCERIFRQGLVGAKKVRNDSQGLISPKNS